MSGHDPWDYIDADGDRLWTDVDDEGVLVSIESKGGDLAQCRLDREARTELAARLLGTSRSFAALVLDGTLG